jgi:hypothetical protein
MLAHQVIEDLIKGANQKVFHEEAVKRIYSCICLSQHFHFGSAGRLQHIRGLKPGALVELKEILIQPPYDQSWFDVTGKWKLGYLIRTRKQWPDWKIQSFEHDGRHWSPHTFALSVIKETGDIISYYEKIWVHDLTEEQYKRIMQENAGRVYSLLGVCMMLLNRKNVEAIKHPAPEQLNKRRKAKGLPPLFSYHTLRVKLPTCH